MAGFMRNKGRSESSSAGSSAAGSEGPRGAEPSAVQNSVAAGGVTADRAAGSETTLHRDLSRNLGATRRREAAVPVEVAPARGQPDQPRRAGEWDAFPSGLARRGSAATAETTAICTPGPAGLARRGAGAAAAATPAAGLARRGEGAAASAIAAAGLARCGAGAAAATAAAGPPAVLTRRGASPWNILSA